MALFATRHDRAAKLRRRPGNTDRHFYPQPAVDIRYSRRLPKNSDIIKLKQIFQGPMKTWPLSAGVSL